MMNVGSGGLAPTAGARGAALLPATCWRPGSVREKSLAETA
jgi:hypothetical protein